MVTLGTNIQQNAANIYCSVGIGKDVVISASNNLFLGSIGSPLGSIVASACTSTQYWKVYINGVERCVLLV